MMDRVFAVVGILGLCAFLGVLVWKVPLLPLVAVCAIGVLMAAFDFYNTLFRRRPG